MKVLVDYHHHDLLYSLHLLFERRLGWELYRPVGLDWFTEGFWKIAEPYGNAPDTIAQYLAIGGGPYDALRRLNGEAYEPDCGTPGVYHIDDPGHPGTTHKAITLAAFKDTPFDLIVSTYGPPHDECYDELQRRYQPRARRMAQMGNIGQTSTQRHVLHSVPYVSREQNHLHYHQEIDRALFRTHPVPTRAFVPEGGGRGPLRMPPRITSLVNLLPCSQIYDQYKSAMRDVSFSAFGISCPDGVLKGALEVSEAMRQANLGWHIKPLDGFGHTAMGWMATGRGVVTRMDEVQEYGWDAPKLFVPGETCVAIQGWDVPAGVAKIRRALEPEECARMGAAAAARFSEICNYDAEEVSIRKFLEAVMA